MDRFFEEPPETPPDLVDRVLARTSGRACGRAETLLLAPADDPLEPTDGDLLRLHLAHCSSCLALSLALGRLALDLPALAEVRPDARFARDVLARTSRAPVRRLLDAAARASIAWQHLVLRPRLAAEGAYLGALMLAGLLGLGGLSGGDLSRHAAALAATNPVRAAAGPVARAGLALGQAAEEVRSTVEASVPPAVDGVEHSLRENAAPFRLAAHRVQRAVVDLWAVGEPAGSGLRPREDTSSTDDPVEENPR